MCVSSPNSNNNSLVKRRVSFAEEKPVQIPDEILDSYMDPYEEALARIYPDSIHEQAARKIQIFYKEHCYLALVRFNDDEAALHEDLEATETLKRLELENIQKDLEEEMEQARLEFEAEIAAAEPKQTEAEAAQEEELAQKLEQQELENQLVILELKADIYKQQKKQTRFSKDIQYEHKRGAELRKIGKRQRKREKKVKSLQKYQRKVKQETKHLRHLERDIDRCRSDSEQLLDTIQQITEYMEQQDISWTRKFLHATQEEEQQDKDTRRDCSRSPSPKSVITQAPTATSLQHSYSSKNLMASKSSQACLTRLMSHSRLIVC